MDLKKYIKQIKIDNGQLGGAIQMIIQSSFPISFMNLATSLSVAYHLFLYKYVSIQVGIAILFCCAISWWIAYYTFIYPSVIRFGNRQNYEHGSPIKKDFENINDRLSNIEEMLNAKEEK